MGRKTAMPFRAGHIYGSVIGNIDRTRSGRSSTQDVTSGRAEKGITHHDQSLALLRMVLSIHDEQGSPIVEAHISYAIELLEA
jgi:hypothetical protein